MWLSGLPVGNVPLGEDPSVHPVLERTASLPVHQTTGSGGSRQFTSQFRPNASPDTGTEPNFIKRRHDIRDLFFNRGAIPIQYATRCFSG